MLVFADLVKQPTSTVGTGTLALDAPATGFRTFSTAVGNGNTCYYAVQDSAGAWEIGIGTVGAGTLARTTIIASSNSNNAVDLAAGVKNVTLVAPATFLQGLAGDNFGDGSDGDVTISADTTLATTSGADDTGYVLKNYNTLTIDASKALTATNRAQLMIIRVKGNCTINGHLHMDKKGAAATPLSDISILVSPPPAYGFALGKVFISVPSIGAAGGATQYGSAVGNAGIAGILGQTGGGGGGSGNSGSGTVASGAGGAFGSCFCGGSGGGAGSYNWTGSVAMPGVAGGAYGGAGGNAGVWTGSANDVCASGAGAGNPVGTGSAHNGTGTASVVAPTGGGGGTLILIVGGTLTIGSNGSVTADGGAGGNASCTGGSLRYAYGGGGAGGGSIILFYAVSYSNAGSNNIHATGGAGGTATATNLALAGGKGGDGSVRGPFQIV